VAHWVLAGRPDADVTGIDVARFRPWQLDPVHRAERTAEILGTVYAAHPPGTQLTTSRGVLRSPVHDRMVAAGAFLRDVSGWESAGWYAGPGATATADPGWGRQPWWTHWEAEHRAVREAAGVFDMSFMAKFVVRGPGAGRVLDRLSAGAVDERDGRITYTQWLGEDGGVVADLTVTRRSPDDFLVVASDTAHAQVLGMLRRGLGEEGAVVSDVTEDLALLSVQGPASRAVLAALDPDTDWGTAAFPFRDVRQLTLAGADVLAVRVTYVGELGWELYVPAGDAARVWDALLVAGEPHGLRPVGLSALSSLRLEKGYRDFGHDLDNTDDVWGAGLGFAVALDKPGGFVGREATLARREAGPPRHRIVSVVLEDPEPLLFHGEVLLRDGVPVGDVRSGSHGWTVGAAVGLAGVSCEAGVSASWLDDGVWEVDVAGRRYPARVSLRPPYDPTSARVRA
jgi:heterotetrameric sarcosine oxidase gamma subunit